MVLNLFASLRLESNLINKIASELYNNKLLLSLRFEYVFDLRLSIGGPETYAQRTRAEH